MRGKEPVCHHFQPSPGITPAHAGKSVLRGRAALGHRGSPPPMRGKARAHLRDIMALWITPAPAGKSQGFPWSIWPGEDHPRPCGEKLSFHDNPPFASGSPPPMRGKEYVTHFLAERLRITPAHAGKSQPPYPRPEGREDHPRPCGEKVRP